MRLKKILALICIFAYMINGAAYAADIAQTNIIETNTAVSETESALDEITLNEEPVAIIEEGNDIENSISSAEENAAIMATADMNIATMAANHQKVIASTHKVTVNDKAVSPQAYNIDGYNYFKLRDIAYLLNGTSVNFDISWDGSKNTINMLTEKSYTAVGGEMSKTSNSAIKVQTSKSTVLLNGSSVSIEGYNINGNNYYKIADVKEKIGFTADFDQASKTVLIKTPVTETPKPDPEPEPEPEPEPRTSHLDGKITVILDAGHGGSDIGAHHSSLLLDGTLIDEKRVNLYVTKYLKQYLEAQGVTVIMVRDTLEEGSSLSLRGTVMEQNADTADLFFSVHHNAHNTQAKGAQVLAQVADQNGGPSKTLANELNKEYANIGLSVRSIWFREGSSGDYYYTNRKAAELQITAVISEFCFIDNDEDVTFIDSDADWQQEAKGLSNAIMRYFEQVEY